MEKRDTKKSIRNLLLFILLIFITFYIIFKDQNPNEILKLLRSVDKKFVLIAVGFMFLYFMCETINVTRTLKELGEKSTFFRNFRYTLIGFFFSSITPAASGGQPMEIYYMSRDGLNVANSTLALLINLTSMQIATISIGIISVIFNFQYMNVALIIFFIIGILLNASALALLIISICSKRVTNWLIGVAIKIMNFFKVKNMEKKQEWINSELAKYQANAVYVKTHKKMIFKTILTTYIQFLIYYSVPYWIYRSFGYNQCNIFEVLSMQAVLFATVSGIPSPGAVGVSEGGFLELFKKFYPKEQIASSMLLCRGVNFYLFVIISLIIVMISSFRDKRRENISSKDKTQEGME
ncbi:MAG: flippase-like domain-containing protein [Clostridia bacterium]|nr:flippase-like domain-containing protein [Clostridia bacterium]